MAGGRSMEVVFFREVGLYDAVREASEMAKENSLALCVF